ncbi:MAG TPA: hypothetical protein VNP92_30455 [Actinophytocola sp.]|nr:hypothetical protein [Actinophytocola sp.]
MSTPRSRRPAPPPVGPPRRHVRRGGLRPPPESEPEPPPAEDTEEGADSGMSRAFRVIAAVVANTTLFTSLLYYFGLVFTQVFFAHFRVHYTLLSQPADEILGRGVDGLFLPLSGIAGAVLVVALVIRLLKVRLSARSWSNLLRYGTPVAGVLGVVCLVVAVPASLDPGSFSDYPGLPGFGAAIGVVLLVLAWRRWNSAAGPITRGVAVVESVITFLLVSIGLFWAVGDYSASVGDRRGYETEARIPAMPSVVVYSALGLNLAGDGVRETQCTQPEAAYKYRYDGLKLLLQSGGQYVFLPATWRTTSGSAFVVPRTDSLLLEFGPPAARPVRGC